jgi:hypothetical protein
MRRLRDASQSTKCAQPARMREQLSQRGFRGPALEGGAAQALDLGAAGLDDAPVWNARGTDGLACPAAEAEVDMPNLLLCEGQTGSLPLG